MTKNKKCTLIFVLIIIGLIIILFVGLEILKIYSLADIFKNERSGIVNCLDDKTLYDNVINGSVIMSPMTIFGRKISCEKNNDCRLDKVEKYCSPNEVSSYGIPLCNPAIKCSPDKTCEYYCR